MSDGTLLPRPSQTPWGTSFPADGSQPAVELACLLLLDAAPADAVLLRQGMAELELAASHGDVVAALARLARSGVVRNALAPQNAAGPQVEITAEGRTKLHEGVALHAVVQKVLTRYRELEDSAAQRAGRHEADLYGDGNRDSR